RLVVPAPVLVNGFVRVRVLVHEHGANTSTSASTGTMAATRTGASTIHRRQHPHQHAVRFFGAH
ncbi:MAG: hypothetical protein ACJ79W_24425, partial [Myxococcales bacterium]